MRQNTKSMKGILTAVLIIAALATGQKAWASNWTITHSNGNFIVTRDQSGFAETVKYRTVSLSAMAGKHFPEKSGSLSFGINETSKSISVEETALEEVPLQYRYYENDRIYYRFEVTDQGGAVLADYSQQIWIGDLNVTYYLGANWLNVSTMKWLAYFNEGSLSSGKSCKYWDVSYTPPTSDVETSGTLNGYVLIDDSYDYSQKAATVKPDGLFVANRAAGSGAYHKLIGNKLYASVYFTEKEKDDGYAYIQILAGDSNAAYDGADPNGEVNTPVNSLYKACFELDTSSDTGSGKNIFPHSADCHNQTEEYQQLSQMDDLSAFYMKHGYLWQQKFRSESNRAGNFNNALVLDPDIGALTIRFDCGGNNDDTFGYKDLYVRWALVDDTAPTVLSSDIAVSPGLYTKGNPVTVTVPFSEPVIVEHETLYVLKTNWGDLILDQNCSGCNVLSFTGDITADAGTVLKINSLELQAIDNIASKIPIKDLIGNTFTGTISKTFSNDVTVDAVYTLSYSLNGGSIAGGNPSKYTAKSDEFTLVNPTRTGYVFTGWTGTDLNGATMTVTIPTGSTGNRSYSATWTRGVIPEWGGNDGANGTSAHPFIISDPEGLVLLSNLTGSDEHFYNCYFRLANDIDMEGVAMTPIGLGDATKFQGYFYGENHVIRNLTISSTSRANNGLFGNLGGTVKDLVIDSSSFSGNDYAGAITAYNNGTIRNCFVLNSSTAGRSDRVSVIRGINYGSVSGCHYHNCTVNGTTKSDMYVVSVPQGATVSGDATFSYAGINYYLENTAITVGAATGYTVSAVSFTPDGGEAVDATDNGDGTWSFALPAADVTVSATVSPAASLSLTANLATVLGEDKYVTTFYHGTLDYQLPEGALAYTASLVGGEVVFHRIGENSDIIPHGTAVIVVAGIADVTLTVLNSTPGVTAHAGNILEGSDTEIATPSGNVYVLGVAGEPAALGFFKYTGATIPAGKAYYVAE